MIIPHSKTYYDSHEEFAVSQVIRSGHVAMGEKIQTFESALAKIAKRRYAVCVDSGFSALRLSLLLLGIKEGDKVGLPAYSCVALANAILSISAVPVPIDNFEHSNVVDIESSNQLKELKAIIAVHTFGEPVNIKRIKSLTNIPIIEDCAHALGTKLYCQQGDITVLSFYATKLLGVGEGGALLIDDPELYEKLVKLRSYVDQLPDGTKFNNKMTDLEGAIGICQLNKLEENIKKRTELALKYHAELQPLEGYGVSFQALIDDKVWYRYVIRVSDSLINSLREHLRNNNIYAEKPVESWGAEIYSENNLVNATKAYLQNLSLPIYPALSMDEQSIIINSIKDFFHD
jgi:perosamine synthetase